MNSELVVAIILSASTLFSFALLWLTQPKHGQLKLPIQSHEQDITFSDDHDPFDVVKPMDLSNGDPIDEQAFWHAVSTDNLPDLNLKGMNILR